MSSLVPNPGSISAAILPASAVSTAASHQLAFVGVGEAVVEGTAPEPVAVGDLDDRDTRPRPGRPHRRRTSVDGELVALGVRSVAQRGVGNANVEFARSMACSLPTLQHVSADFVADRWPRPPS